MLNNTADAVLQIIINEVAAAKLPVELFRKNYQAIFNYTVPATPPSINVLQECFDISKIARRPTSKNISFIDKQWPELGLRDMCHHGHVLCRCEPEKHYSLMCSMSDMVEMRKSKTGISEELLLDKHLSECTTCSHEVVERNGLCIECYCKTPRGA